MSQCFWEEQLDSPLFKGHTTGKVTLERKKLCAFLSYIEPRLRQRVVWAELWHTLAPQMASLRRIARQTMLCSYWNDNRQFDNYDEFPLPHIKTIAWLVLQASVSHFCWAPWPAFAMTSGGRPKAPSSNHSCHHYLRREFERKLCWSSGRSRSTLRGDGHCQRPMHRCTGRGFLNYNRGCGRFHLQGKFRLKLADVLSSVTVAQEPTGLQGFAVISMHTSSQTFRKVAIVAQ